MMTNVDKVIAMRFFSPMWSGMPDSSLWDEQDYVVKIFLTMLAKKDADFIYRGNAYNLSKQSRKSEQEVLDAFKILSSPDTKRLEPQPFEGRRIQAVEDGWLILNAQKYQELMQIEMEKARWRRGQKAKRERDKLKRGLPLAGEAEYCEAERNGATPEQLQAIMDKHLPK